ncbi:MAG: 2-amino-4-hydroxy-6-hydroxymethyldihydropteridine diphosphokinase [Cypionkella sp.]|nr:2-amino-4-hydroxy-6-hydroxymethyldihydropteridine diphosphokinase [Cypionkella sp.]
MPKPSPDRLFLIAFGGNQPVGDLAPLEVMGAAVQALTQKGLRYVAQSAFYRTPAFPAGSGPDYVNGAACLSAAPEMSAQTVLSALHDVEAAFGRRRDRRWGPRTLDLDLLAVGDLVLPDAGEQTRWRSLSPEDQAQLTPDRLILPHPRMQDRAFVLVPLAEVAPDWRHPILGQTVREMRDALPAADLAEVRRIG